MKQFIKNYCNKFYNYNSSKDFVSICATGGSGSSFLVDKFIDDKWRVCIRPDGGHQKANITSFDIYFTLGFLMSLTRRIMGGLVKLRSIRGTWFTGSNTLFSYIALQKINLF